MIMRILDRYVVKNFLFPLIYCMVAFILLFIIGDLFEHLDDFLAVEQWPPVMLRYYLLFIPSTFIYIFPVAILLGLLYSLGRMQKNNEITAMRVGGISIYRITFPLLLLCFFLSLLTLWVNETIVPQSLKQSELLKEEKLGGKLAFREKLRDITFYNPLTNRSFYFETFDTRDNLATGVKIYELKPDGQPYKTISAQEAAWLDENWWLFQGLIRVFPAEGPPTKKVLTKEVFDFKVRPEDLQESRKELATLSYRQLKELLERKRGYPLSTLRPALVELHQKISLPLACLIMGFIGVAFGLKIGRGGMLAGVGTSLILGFLYYVLYSVSVAMGKQGLISPWLAAWLGNIIFGFGGIYMLIRAN